MKKIILFFLLFFIIPTISNAESSAYLKTFEVHNGEFSIPFTKTNNIYTVFLEENATELKFYYETEEELAVVEVLNNQYISGASNEMTIKVSSVDNKSQQIYTIYLEKKKDQQTSFQTDQYTALNIPSKKEIPHLAFIVVTSCLSIILLLFKFLVFNIFRKPKIARK